MQPTDNNGQFAQVNQPMANSPFTAPQPTGSMPQGMPQGNAGQSQYSFGEAFSLAEFMQMHHNQVFEASVTSRSTGVVVPGLMFGSAFAAFSKNSGIRDLQGLLPQARNMQVVQLIQFGTGNTFFTICRTGIQVSGNNAADQLAAALGL